MWALYSQDRSSVQIATTLGNLQQASLKLAQKSSDPRPAISRDSEEGQFLDRSQISTVSYDDLKEMGKKIDRRRRAYDKIEAAGMIRPPDFSSSASHRDHARSRQYQFTGLALKDASFAHEAEVRLILTYAPYTPETLAIASNDLKRMAERDDTDANDPGYERSMLLYARAILREEALKLRLPCKDSIALPLFPRFISEVTIDPRCSAHKRRFMESYFKNLGVQIAESTCFGHAANHFSVKPRSKLLNGAI